MVGIMVLLVSIIMFICGSVGSIVRLFCVSQVLIWLVVVSVVVDSWGNCFVILFF